MTNIELVKINLPDFGMSEELVEIPPQQFEQRFREAVKQMHNQSLDFLFVFADREHCANLTFLTNLDPRFEEAL